MSDSNAVNTPVAIDEPVPTVVASPRIPPGGVSVPAPEAPPRMPPGMPELADLPPPPTFNLTPAGETPVFVPSPRGPDPNTGQVPVYRPVNAAGGPDGVVRRSPLRDRFSDPIPNPFAFVGPTAPGTPNTREWIRDLADSYGLPRVPAGGRVGDLPNFAGNKNEPDPPIRPTAILEPKRCAGPTGRIRAEHSVPAEGTRFDEVSRAASRPRENSEPGLGSRPMEPSTYADLTSLSDRNFVSPGPETPEVLYASGTQTPSRSVSVPVRSKIFQC